MVLCPDIIFISMLLNISASWYFTDPGAIMLDVWPNYAVRNKSKVGHFNVLLIGFGPLYIDIDRC